MGQARRRGRPDVRRVARRFLLGSGPLKRGTDRVQMLARVLLLLIVLAAVPVAVVVGALTGSRERAVADEQAHSRHLTRAVLLRDAPTATVDPTTGTTIVQFTDVPAMWRSPRGAERVGVVPALDGTRAGTSVPVWVAADGRLTAAPLDRGDVGTAAVTAGAATLTGIALVACAAYRLLCGVVARRRDRQWTEGWAAVGPVWRATSR